MLKIINPKKIDNALFEYHSTLASVILTKLKDEPKQKIVELGPGPGTFTIPFLDKLNNEFEVYYCVDPYRGPYKENIKLLMAKIANSKFESKVEIIQRDAAGMDKILSDIDLVVGHEVLCDLNTSQLERVLAACFKALKVGGCFIHSELSPVALNRAEELVQISNNYSKEPISNTTWFSPSADELAKISYKIGFRTINFDYIKIPIKFGREAALELLNRWKIKNEFFEKYKTEIERDGLEFPMEQILLCTK